MPKSGQNSLNSLKWKQFVWTVGICHCSFHLCLLLLSLKHVSWFTLSYFVAFHTDVNSIDCPCHWTKYWDFMIVSWPWDCDGLSDWVQGRVRIMSVQSSLQLKTLNCAGEGEHLKWKYGCIWNTRSNLEYPPQQFIKLFLMFSWFIKYPNKTLYLVSTIHILT